MINNIQFVITNWKQSHQELKQIRTNVFIDEQQVPAELEWDEFDEQSLHFLALRDNKAIATARLKPDGQIGRMAVIKKHRNKGVGTRLLTEVLLQARKHGYNMVYLHAQKKAIDFYKRFDFIKNGADFMDAGIVHRGMYKLLSNNKD